MKKIIIAVHGMRNKPDKRVLSRWWKESIRLGLESIGRPRPFFRFAMVYWANWLYPKPLNPNATDPNDPLYVEFPFIKTEPRTGKKSSRFRHKMLRRFNQLSEWMFSKKEMSVNLSNITDLILQRFFNDLHIYYNGTLVDRRGQERPAKEIIREELAGVLHRHRRKRIMLIGHSMGSIIAYDVLNLSAAHVPIDTLVTMGSPLGLPAIAGRFLSELKAENPQVEHLTTPENVRRYWFNLSDLDDQVALNFDLGDDYAANSRGLYAVDYIVENTYKYAETSNPHKVYGYLQTPEFAMLVDEFLRSDQGPLARWFDRLVISLYRRWKERNRD